SRRSVIAEALFHSMPESSTAIRTFGCPVVNCHAVLTGCPARQPTGCVIGASTMLAPRTPHSSSSLPLISRSLCVVCSGVAENFQSTPPENSLGTVPGGNLNVCGSRALPPLGGTYGKSAYAADVSANATAAQITARVADAARPTQL